LSPNGGWDKFNRWSQNRQQVDSISTDSRRKHPASLANGGVALDQKDRDATFNDFVMLGKEQGLMLASVYLEIIRNKNKPEAQSASRGFWEHHGKAIIRKKYELQAIGSSDTEIKIFIDSMNLELNITLCCYVKFGTIDKMHDDFDIDEKDIINFLHYDPSQCLSLNSSKDEFEMAAIDAGVAAANLFYLRMHFMPIELVSQMHKSNSAEHVSRMYAYNFNEKWVESFCKEADSVMYNTLEAFGLDILE
jgi:hypothetical protein